MVNYLKNQTLNICEPDKQNCNICTTPSRSMVSWLSLNQSYNKVGWPKPPLHILWEYWRERISMWTRALSSICEGPFRKEWEELQAHHNMYGSFNSIWHTLVRVKKGVVYEIPCHGCDQVHRQGPWRSIFQSVSKLLESLIIRTCRTAVHVVQNDHKIGRMPGSFPQTSGGKA